MKLTKRQRLAAYKYVLKELESKQEVIGLCINFKIYMQEKYHEHFFCWEILETFPEFANKKPRNTRVFWWKKFNKAPRIKALKKCIEELTPKTK